MDDRRKDQAERIVKRYAHLIEMQTGKAVRPFGTPSGRCRMTSTVWLEIAEWWMPSTPSMTFGGVLAP